jgi:hypothetical protein
LLCGMHTSTPLRLFSAAPRIIICPINTICKANIGNCGWIKEYTKRCVSSRFQPLIDRNDILNQKSFLLLMLWFLYDI